MLLVVDVAIVVVMVVDSINAISGRCSDSGGDGSRQY